MIVTDHGKPVLEVRRYDNTARTPLEELRGSVLFCEDAFEPLGEDDWEAYR